MRSSKGPEFVHPAADLAHHVDVRALISSADVVGLSGATARQDEPQSSGMVLHIKPIANIRAVSVNRERCPRERVENYQRDQLLGEMVGTIIVRTWKRSLASVRSMPCL